MRVRRAQHIAARLARQAHIVGITTPATKQPRVFLAPDVIADLLYAHAPRRGSTSSPCAPGDGGDRIAV